MATASNARSHRGKLQSTLQGFGRVSKSTSVNSQLKVKNPDSQRTPQSLNKRKRDDSDDGKCSSKPSRVVDVALKKQKLQLATPPPSQPATEDSSPVSPDTANLQNASDQQLNRKAISKATLIEDFPALMNVLSLHASFLRAVSIHFAYNGVSTPAELTTLMRTITRLWKQREVVVEDIRRMLALYEVAPEDVSSASGVVEQKVSPFKLTTSGVGTNSQTRLEYVAQECSPTLNLSMHLLGEEHLQTIYKAQIQWLLLESRLPGNSHLKFLHGPLCDFPLLSCAIGVQSALRQEKASNKRTELLGRTAPSQPRQKASHFTSRACESDSDSESHPTQTFEAKNARITSLFARVAAKQAALASSSAPTAESLLRHHAIDRIPEVVEILRMKQHQKMGASFQSAVHLTPSKVRSKVSFSMGQLMLEIKDSSSVPIGDEEAKMCLRMLGAVSAELGWWLQIVEIGMGDQTMRSVVLSGSGVSGMEAKQAVEKHEKRRA